MKKLLSIALATTLIITAFGSYHVFGESSSLTADEALKIAKEQIPYKLSETTVHMFTENDYEDFEVRFYDEKNYEYHEIEVNKNTKSITSIDTEKIYDDGDANVKITKEKAMEIVKSEWPNATILSTKTDFDDDDKKYKYEVEFKSNDAYGEYKINPSTGVIIERDINIVKGISNIITFSEAKNAALKVLPNSVVKDINLEHNNGSIYYEVELFYPTNNIEYVVVVDGQNGNILWKGIEDDYDDDINYGNNNYTQYITYSEARNIVAKKLPNGNIKTINFNFDDENSVYYGVVEKDSVNYTFSINAITGNIISWEKGAVENSSTKYITLEKAKSIALGKVPNANITKIKFEYDDGRAVYEGEMYKENFEYDFEIDAVTGNITDWDVDGYDDWHDDYDDKYDDDYYDDDYDDYYTVSSTSYKTYDEIKSIVLAKVPGGTVKEIEFDYDDGKAVYEGEIRKGNMEYEFKVNATNGTIIEWEADYDD